MNTPPNAVSRLLRLVAILCAVLLALLIGRFIIHVVTSGTLTVTAGSGDLITVVSAPIQKGPDLGKSQFSYHGTGTLSVRVRAGAYIVSAQNGASKTNELVSVGWLSQKTTALTPAGAASLDPVLYDTAGNLAVDSTRMVYLAYDTNAIAYTNTDNAEQTISSSSQVFSSVRWANAEYGIGQDSSGVLYVISGDSIRPLTSPASTSHAVATAYAVAPDKTIYLGFGSHVYRGTDSGSFTAIYSKFLDNDSLVAANGKVLILSPGGPNDNGVMTLIGTDGKQITRTLDYAVSGWTPWSQNGSYIMVSAGAKPELLDASLNQVAVIPQPGVLNGGAWLDDNKVYYYSGGQVWSYDVSAQKSDLLVTTPGGRAIQGLAVSADKSSVYITTGNVGDSTPHATYRAGLQGQKVSSVIATLAQILPITNASYSIGFVNFSGTPIIKVTAYPGSDPNSDLSGAEQSVQGVVDTSNVKFVVQAED